MARRPVLPSLLLATALVLVGASAVRAQGQGPPTTGAETTTTSGPADTTTTSPGLTIPKSGETTTTTTAARTSTTLGPAPSGPAAGGGDGAPSPGAPTTIPPDAQRMISSVVRSRPNNTYALMAALAPLQAEGYTATEAAVLGFGAFPVAGPTTFVHDWLFPRYVPTFHLHQGTDLFAPLGTPVRAPFDGTLRHTDGAVGGMASNVTAADGTYAYLAHLSAFLPGQTDGMSVRQGDVVGFVGNTGDAAGGPTHVHFELHPKGGGAMDPKATLDAWIADAIARAPGLIEQVRAARSSASAPAPGASVTEVAPVAPEVPALDGAAAEQDGPEVLWAVSANPAAGTLGVAADLVAGALGTVDWADRRGSVEVAGGQAVAATALDGLFPRPFAGA